jgi:hypothetical protein
MKPDVAAIVSALGVGTVFGSVVTLVLKHHLDRRSERQKRRIETDRATYQERMTRLIAANLCALIRSNRYREGEREELAQLVQELSDGAHQVRFLDAKVQAAWVCLVKKSAEYGWRRLTDVVTERDIADYTRIWEAWLTTARESFGPLPESDRPVMRRSEPTQAIREVA